MTAILEKIVAWSFFGIVVVAVAVALFAWWATATWSKGR